MYQEIIEKVTSVLLLAGVFLILPGHVPLASAQVIPSGVPFYGSVVSLVLPTPLCPVTHTLILDFATDSLLGIAVVTGSQVYSHYNLSTSGTFVLGTYVPAIIPCAVPYPLVPISQVGTS